MTTRNSNLDLIRASAITLVLIHHTGQLMQNISGIAHEYTNLGAYGVDLFFVLSGWLIGSLYWKETIQYGDIALLRFWGRRWLRTIPPYFVVLPFAYAGVYYTRGEPFNIDYLFFLQNYEDIIPFYLVSWSLCVEEHFYLIIPILLTFLTMIKTPLRIALPALLIVSFMARLLDPSCNPVQMFGYSETASHLNFSGLIIGVWFSYLSVFDKNKWKMIQELCKIIITPLFLGVLFIPFLSLSDKYYIADNYVVVFFGSLLARLTVMKPLRIAKLRVIYFLSITSYSIYLTHSMVLHFCILLTDKYSFNRESVFIVWVAVIFVVGSMFFGVIERPSIRLRDKLIARRSESITTRLTDGY